MNIPNARDLAAIAPQLIVAATAILVLMADTLAPRISKRLLANLAVLGLIIAGVVAWLGWKEGLAPTAMQGLVMHDGYSAFFAILFCLGTALSILLSTNYLERERENYGEYYALMLFATVGAMVMAASGNLICIFIGLEILSIALYILCGYETQRLRSEEAGMKYFLLGAFASAFLLYGMALVYGATGSVNLGSISESLQQATTLRPDKNYLLLAGIALMIVGFGFKVAVVPFHIWTPDVYEGAPTSVTAFMSVVAKAAGFAALTRVMVSGFHDQQVQVQISAVMASIAALTMLVGNVVAVVQPSIKRMLAYSSIAHAGYILAGLVVAVRPPGASMGLDLPSSIQGKALSAVLFYLLTYLVTNLGAFAVVLALRRRGEEVKEISDLAGVGARHPLLGGLMALFMLSLAGLPPFAGFFGKLFIFQALVGMNPPLVWLIVLFALTSVVSFYYYLGVVRAMYIDRATPEQNAETTVATDWGLKLALGATAIGTVVLGIWAGTGMGLAERVANAFFAAGPMAMR